MSSVLLSPGNRNLYLQELFPKYENTRMPPDNVIGITREAYGQFLDLHSGGREVGADSSGRPIWTNFPPLSKGGKVSAVKMKEISSVSEVNTYANTHQRPGKAAIGRLRSEELMQHNSWLDYLDTLELIDTSCTPDIEWPTPSAVQAR